ncbi:hypothetical protein ACHAXT_009395 [Thalassiosira profunda]
MDGHGTGGPHRPRHQGGHQRTPQRVPSNDSGEGPNPPAGQARGYAGYQPHHRHGSHGGGGGHHSSHGGGGGHHAHGGGGHRRGSAHGPPGLSSPAPGGHGHYGHGPHGGGGSTPRSGSFRKGFHQGGQPQGHGGHGVSQKDREMMSIYGRGGDGAFDGANPNSIPLNEPVPPHGGFGQDGPHGEAGVAGHYGPAAASQGNEGRGLERGGSFDRGGSARSLGSADSFARPALDRGNSDRGYSVGGERPGPPQRFGSQGNVFSPQPHGQPHGGHQRQPSWQGERHRRDPSRDAPFSPHPHGGVPPPPMASPVASNNERGHSFSPGGSHGGMQRGRSGGHRHGEPRHRDHEGMEGIAAPPLSRTLSSPGEIREGRRDSERKSFGGMGSAAAASAAAAARDAQPGLSFRSPPPLQATGKPRETPHSALASPKQPDSAATDSLYGGLGASPGRTPGRRPMGSPRYASPKASPGLASPGEVTERKALPAHGTPQQPILAGAASPEDGEIPTPASQHLPKPSSPKTPRLSSATKAAAPETPKEQPSLTCAHLLDAEKIRKAESIVASMVRLADFHVPTVVPPTSGAVGGAQGPQGGTHGAQGAQGLPLPTKMEITHCMTTIEHKIKGKMKASVGARREVRELQEREAGEKRAREEAQERKRREEKAEEERMAREEEGGMRRARDECGARVREREATAASAKREREGTLTARKGAADDRRRAELARLQADRQSEINQESRGLTSEIAALRAQLEEAERSAAEEELLALEKEAGDAHRQIPEDDPTDAGEKVPTLDMPGKMSGLVAGILAENQRRAREAHLEVLEAIPYFPNAAKKCAGEEGSEEVSNEEWSNRARNVTGLHDALFADPTAVPCYAEHNARFLALAPRIKDCIRRKNAALAERWEQLATQYVVRQQTHTEAHGWDEEMAARGGYFSAAALPKNSGEGGADGAAAAGASPGVRGNNPYRRPRRGISPGDVVRSDYELEQQIAELAAKEAMEKRIREGGCALPRQEGWLERQLFATHTNGFFGREVDDPYEEMEERRHVNPWSDMEKCIFLDRFLHHPKDFRKIASFLQHKSTKDCVAFYYDSKKAVPYKHALKEFLQRKKRRDDAVSWDATIQCCLAMGARVKAGTRERPLRFELPAHDFTYRTRLFHPMRLEVFETLEEAVAHARPSEDAKAHGGKKKRSNWFILDPHEKAFLKHGDDGDHHHHHHSSKRRRTAKDAAGSESEEDARPKKASRKAGKGSGEGKKKPATKPQKWKDKEKALFLAALDAHGHDWTAVAAAVGTRSAVQVKNYFYDNRKSIERQTKKADRAPKKKKAKRAKKPAASAAATELQRAESAASAQYLQQQQYQEHIRQLQAQQAQQQIERLRQQQIEAAVARQLQQQQLQQALAMRGQQVGAARSFSPHGAQGQYTMQQQQYQHQGGGGAQQGDLERIYQAAASAGIPASALEAALASARGGGGGQQQQQQQDSQSQQLANIELLRRLQQQQQNQGGGNYGYQR